MTEEQIKNGLIQVFTLARLQATNQNPNDESTIVQLIQFRQFLFDKLELDAKELETENADIKES